MLKQTAICRSVFMLTLLFFLSLTSFSQTTFKVSGKVSDENGKPVEGATVQVKGTTIATSTSADGTYSLMAPSGAATLVITSVGFTQMEVVINDKPEVNVRTMSISSSLQDVVVIGYTTVKRKDVTGAIGGINQKDIKSRPVDNALQAMQGKVAGVDIGSNERPGTIPSINIRGVRSLTASNTPLFVVDGIPLITGSIDNINPQDIE
ncbi:MAG TPA: carboxypeptidase-like regulatory domain-containing protein, partial [Chitinophagaceae bacterium]|nr:carboxypeptidase-like regulatory domain-containing protein [Chitinophagaceae bacterium]